MMGEHSSYHQAISRDEAERRLKQCGGHCYLTRYSKLNKCYVLSVYEYQLPPLDPVIEHFHIMILKNGMIRIRNKSVTFTKIESLLDHYEVKRIDPGLRSIGEPYTEKEYKRVQREEIRKQQEGRQQELERQDRQRQLEAEAERLLQQQAEREAAEAEAERLAEEGRHQNAANKKKCTIL